MASYSCTDVVITNSQTDPLRVAFKPSLQGGSNSPLLYAQLGSQNANNNTATIDYPLTPGSKLVIPNTCAGTLYVESTLNGSDAAGCIAAQVARPAPTPNASIDTNINVIVGALTLPSGSRQLMLAGDIDPATVSAACCPRTSCSDWPAANPIPAGAGNAIAAAITAAAATAVKAATGAKNVVVSNVTKVGTPSFAAATVFQAGATSPPPAYPVPGPNPPTAYPSPPAYPPTTTPPPPAYPTGTCGYVNLTKAANAGRTRVTINWGIPGIARRVLVLPAGLVSNMMINYPAYPNACGGTITAQSLSGPATGSVVTASIVNGRRGTADSADIVINAPVGADGVACIRFVGDVAPISSKCSPPPVMGPPPAYPAGPMYPPPASNPYQASVMEPFVDETMSDSSDSDDVEEEGEDMVSAGVASMDAMMPLYLRRRSGRRSGRRGIKDYKKWIDYHQQDYEPSDRFYPDPVSPVFGPSSSAMDVVNPSRRRSRSRRGGRPDVWQGLVDCVFDSVTGQWSCSPQ